ncbi:hypothetical protein [Massilia sp. Root418]|uniref:hypothetical protein n=1 Tax=Massilia sp. Root418 TaxID=1736532 RepID=UPI000A49B32A|nr:hypothetical protein [Massilia sp. Root418]
MKSYFRFYDRSVAAIKSGVFAGSLTILLANSSIATTLTPTAVPKNSASAPEMRLRGDDIVLPIAMVREFPFIEGSVAGVPGKLMLDTGYRAALGINDNRIPVVNPTDNGVGIFGSGQKYASRIAPAVHNVIVADLHFPKVTQVRSSDASLLETITPDFLGWLGHDFFEGYAIKLDYQKLQASFHRGQPEEYLRGEKIVDALPFNLRKIPNIPVMKGKLGDLDTTVAFDTGQNGALFIDDDAKSRLIIAGVLKPTNDAEKFDIPLLHIEGRTFTDLKNIDVMAAPFPAAMQTGLDDKTLITLGFAFLNKYKTVWDYKQRKIHILER